MPAYRRGNLKQTHVRLVKKVERLAFAQIEGVMMSEYSDKSKLAFVVGIVEKREDALDDLEAMFDEARCRHM